MPVQNFRVGEMLNKRTPNTKTWINFDGSYTTEIYQGLVHYQDAAGNLHNINTDLFDEADFNEIDFPVAKDGDSLFYEQQAKSIKDKKKNRLNRDNYDFQGLAVPYEVKIPRNIRRGYSIGKGASKLKFIPVNASVSKGYVEGNKITYPDVWNDADLVLELLPEGIKETIILKTDKAPINFSFEVQGELAEELKIQPMWLMDAEGTKRDVLQGVSEVDGKVHLDIAADTSNLVYPIEIDPTVTIQPDGSGIDTYIYQGNTTGNYGTQVGLYLGHSGTSEYRSLIKFDLTQVPVGAVISSATLTLYLGSKGSEFGFNDFDCHPLTKPFVETEATWQQYAANQLWSTQGGDYNSSVMDRNYIDNVLGNKVLDVINTVKHVVSNTNYGFLLKIDELTGYTNHWAFFNSSDHTTATSRPKLTITYNEPPTAPLVIAPNGGETWNSLHTIEFQNAYDIITTVIGDLKSSFLGSSNTMGQSYTAVGNNKISGIALLAKGNYAGNSITVRLKNDNGAGLPGSMTYYTQTFTGITSVDGQFIFLDFLTPFSVSQGQKVVIEISWSGSVQFHLSIGNTYPNSNMYYGGAIDNNYDISMKVFERDYSSVKYQIQLSTNNGGSWKDIVTLTAAGVTSYPYDFINEAETSTALIRVRAYDGSAYGPWDTSDGVFTIVHNQAPTAPTGLSPSGVPKDRASVNRFAWLHNDPNAGDPQSKFDLQWRLQGASTWNNVTQATTNNYYDMPAGTLPKGTIEWQVRTYDQAGLPSPYSALQVFVAGDKPPTPIITAPADGSVIPVSKPVVQWSSVDQVGYQVKVLNAAGTSTLWDTGQVNSGNKAVTVGIDLENNTGYKIQVLVKGAEGIWSDADNHSISVSYTPPALPVLSTVVNDTAGIITINIDNPTPQGTEPNVSYNDLYRRESGSSTWERIATNLANNGSYVDFTAASEKLYEYKVIVQGSNETIRESLLVSVQVKLRGIYLHVVGREQETSRRFFMGEEKNSSVWNLNHTFHKFAGRKNLVIDTEDSTEYGVSFTLKIWDNDERKALEAIIYSQEVVCFRDGRGRKVFGVFVTFPLEDAFWGESTSLNLNKIDYKEEI